MAECAVYFAFGKLQDGEWRQFGDVREPVQRFTPMSTDYLDRTLTIPAGSTRSLYNRISSDPASDFHIIELLSDDADAELEVWTMKDASNATTGYAEGTTERWNVEFLTNKLPFTIPGYQAFVDDTYAKDSGGTADLPTLGSSSTRVVGAWYKIQLVNNGTADLKVRQVYQK